MLFIKYKVEEIRVLLGYIKSLNSKCIPNNQPGRKEEEKFLILATVYDRQLDMENIWSR